MIVRLFAEILAVYPDIAISLIGPYFCTNETYSIFGSD